MSSVSGVSSNTMEDFINKYENTTTENQAAVAKTSDKDIFLNLMVTQMQYQDPLDPQDNSEYLSQMAQFTTLEIMENMGHSSEMTQASSMIGKVVTATNSDGDNVIGVVDGMKVLNGDVYLRVGEEDIELSKVQAVTGQDGADKGILDYTKLTYANSLVGKIVTGVKKEVNADGVETMVNFDAMVQSSNVDENGNITLKCFGVEDGSDITIELTDISQVTEMVPAEEDILAYVKQMYEIIAKTNESADNIETALKDVTE